MLTLQRSTIVEVDQETISTSELMPTLSNAKNLYPTIGGMRANSGAWGVSIAQTRKTSIPLHIPLILACRFFLVSIAQTRKTSIPRHADECVQGIKYVSIAQTRKTSIPHLAHVLASLPVSCFNRSNAKNLYPTQEFVCALAVRGSFNRSNEGGH